MSAPVAPEATSIAHAKATAHLSALDAVRGLAALAVTLYHFTANGWLAKDHWLAQAGWYGHLGVRAFFVLSGIVVPLAMWRSGYTPRAFFPFLARRLVRLYPPYAASVILTALGFLGAGVAFTWPALAAHTLYLNEFLGLPWLIDVYWTLAIEVQFYVAIGLLWPAAIHRRGSLFALFSAAVLAGSFLITTERTLAHLAPYFLLGLSAFRLHAPLGARWWNAAVVAASLITITILHGPVSAVAGAIPAALLAVSSGVPRLLCRLGDISYSLYLFHLWIGGTFLAIAGNWSLPPTAHTAMIPVALALSLAGAMLAHRLIEVPAIAWAKRIPYRPRN